MRLFPEPPPRSTAVAIAAASGSVAAGAALAACRARLALARGHRCERCGGAIPAKEVRMADRDRPVLPEGGPPRLYAWTDRGTDERFEGQWCPVTVRGYVRTDDPQTAAVTAISTAAAPCDPAAAWRQRLGSRVFKVQKLDRALAAVDVFSEDPEGRLRCRRTRGTEAAEAVRRRFHDAGFFSGCREAITGDRTVEGAFPRVSEPTPGGWAVHIADGGLLLWGRQTGKDWEVKALTEQPLRVASDCDLAAAAGRLDIDPRYDVLEHTGHYYAAAAPADEGFELEPGRRLSTEDPYRYANAWVERAPPELPPQLRSAIGEAVAAASRLNLDTGGEVAHQVLRVRLFQTGGALSAESLGRKCNLAMRLEPSAGSKPPAGSWWRLRAEPPPSDLFGVLGLRPPHDTVTVRFGTSLELPVDFDAPQQPLLDWSLSGLRIHRSGAGDADLRSVFKERWELGWRFVDSELDVPADFVARNLCHLDLAEAWEALRRPDLGRGSGWLDSLQRSLKELALRGLGSLLPFLVPELGELVTVGHGPDGSVLRVRIPQRWA